MTDAPTNPNVCPTCGTRNTGATFGWEPQRINDDEVVLTGVGFACGDCDSRWFAHGHVMLAQRNGGIPSAEAQLALLEAIAQAGELRIELLEDDEGER